MPNAWTALDKVADGAAEALLDAPDDVILSECAEGASDDDLDAEAESIRAILLDALPAYRRVFTIVPEEERKRFRPSVLVKKTRVNGRVLMAGGLAAAACLLCVWFLYHPQRYHATTANGSQPPHPSGEADSNSGVVNSKVVSKGSVTTVATSRRNKRSAGGIPFVARQPSKGVSPAFTGRSGEEKSIPREEPDDPKTRARIGPGSDVVALAAGARNRRYDYKALSEGVSQLAAKLEVAEVPDDGRGFRDVIVEELNHIKRIVDNVPTMPDGRADPDLLAQLNGVDDDIDKTLVRVAILGQAYDAIRERRGGMNNQAWMEQYFGGASSAAIKPDGKVCVFSNCPK